MDNISELQIPRRGRVRGFADWRPQKRTLALVAVQDVLEQYADYLPLTLRQIFYRLVGTDVIGKTEKEYANLGEMINRARRAEIIPMSSIRDDGFIGGYHTRIGYTGPEEFAEEVTELAEAYAIDRQQGQHNYLVLLCEAGGMVPQLERVANPYGVTVKSSGGFDSTTVKHLLGESWDDIEAGHIGDYDASGECMYDALKEDVESFGGHYDHMIEFVRLAVTPEHITQYDLPTAPPKKSSHQEKKLKFTTQAEALDPQTLAAIVREWIESRMDMDIYRQAVKREAHQRKAVIEMAQRFNEV